MSMGHQLYMIRFNKQLYNVTVPSTGRSCLVGMTCPHKANKLRTHVATRTPKFTIDSLRFVDSFEQGEYDTMEIIEIDYQDTAFYKMMKLNNFALLICNDFVASDTEIAFDGELVDVEYPPDDEHRFYFDRLLELP